MGVRLIENSRLTGKIIVSPRAWEYEREAGALLKGVFEKMTQDEARLTFEAEGGVIIIGSAMFFYGERQREYSADEYSWYTKNGKVFIDGGERGLACAVRDFLESIGCLMGVDGVEKIPLFCDLGIPEKSELLHFSS